MPVEKIPASPRQTAKSPAKAVKKPTAAKFKQTLSEAVSTQKAKIARSLKEDALDPRKLQSVKDKIARGFYNRPDTLAETADKLLNKNR
jgi:anti-sigma28 factor (negative regulator of flagellin synthesis)